MGSSRGRLVPVSETSPTVWRAADFADSASWTVELSRAERGLLRELARASAERAADELLAPVVARVRHALVDGPGFTLVRGFPVDELSPRQSEVTYMEIGASLGTLVRQDRAGSLTTHIRDERLPPDSGARRFQTNQRQDFHCDAADVVGLLCLRPAKSGGLSRIISSHAVYNDMLRRDPELTAQLLEPFPWSRHAGSGGGDTAYFELAPIQLLEGVPRLSVIPWFIRQSQRDPAVPRLSAAQLAALDLIEDVMRNPDLQVVIDFAAGDMQFLNNATVLHARDAYIDDDDPAFRRHLVRLWLTTEVPIAPEVLTPRAGPAAR